MTEAEDKNKAEKETLTVDDLEFKSTKEGIKFLGTLLVEHNELNHIRKKEERQAEEDTDKILGTGNVREQCIPNYEVDMPNSVMNTLGLAEEDTIKFIEENDRIYIEKTEKE